MHITKKTHKKTTVGRISVILDVCDPRGEMGDDIEELRMQATVGDGYILVFDMSKSRTFENVFQQFQVLLDLICTRLKELYCLFMK